MGTDLSEPFDLHSVGQLHHHGPPVVVWVACGGVVAEPWLMRTEFHPMAHILRNGAYFLQQGHIGIHLNQISPRLVHG